MKFGSARYWRQTGDCCIFFEVVNVIADTEEVAELKVTWIRQMDKGYKTLSQENIRVRAKDFGRWNIYTPRGERIPGYAD